MLYLLRKNMCDNTGLYISEYNQLRGRYRNILFINISGKITSIDSHMYRTKDELSSFILEESDDIDYLKSLLPFYMLEMKALPNVLSNI